MGFQKFIPCKTEEEFFDSLIPIYSVLYIPENRWLTPREREFFVQCIILYNRGVNLASKEAIKHWEARLGFKPKNRSVYIYRTFLLDKEWLERTKDSLEIPAYFKGDFKNITELSLFNVAVQYPVTKKKEAYTTIENNSSNIPYANS